MNKGTLKAGLSNLGLVLGSVVLAIALAEIGLRVAHIPAPTPSSQTNSQQSPPPQPTPEAQAAVTQSVSAAQPTPTAQLASASGTSPTPEPVSSPTAQLASASESSPTPEPVSSSNPSPTPEPTQTVKPEAKPPAEQPVFHDIDPDVGWALKAGASGMFTAEGVAFVQINSQGLRDREHSLAKPPNTFRIAVLGDSFSEALQVPVDQTYWSILERQLQNCSSLKGRKVEVINFGVTNYGTTQQLITLRNKVWAYSPDLVLLQVFTGNDITDNYRPLDPRNRPYFVFKNGKLVEDLSFRTPDKTLPPYSQTRVDIFPGKLVRNSRILQLIKKVEIENRNRELERTRSTTYNNLYLEPKDADWQEAWRVTEALMAQMYQEVIAKNAQFLVVTLSNEVQVNPNRSFRQGFKGQSGIKGDLFYPDRRIKALGDREGFTVFNLAPPMQAYADKTGNCLHGFDNALLCGGHWNGEGHRLAGELLAPQVCKFLSRNSSQGGDR